MISVPGLHAHGLVGSDRISAAGSWDSVAGHQANIHGGAISADKAISWYIEQGVHPSKVVMGIPLYGMSFAPVCVTQTYQIQVDLSHRPRVQVSPFLGSVVDHGSKES